MSLLYVKYMLNIAAITISQYSTTILQNAYHCIGIKSDPGQNDLIYVGLLLLLFFLDQNQSDQLKRYLVSSTSLGATCHCTDMLSPWLPRACIFVT